MGVLNVTPDSFYDGGRWAKPEDAISRAGQMMEDGADIIDVGGESTRPGAEAVSEDEELRRVIPVIEGISKISGRKAVVSIDTYKSSVASAALDSGAGMINDISGLRYDPGMAGLAAKKSVPVIIMHMQGNPKRMQESPQYGNVIEEITGFLGDQARYALKNGIKKENIVIDPGIGFGKTTQHNVEILQNLHRFTATGYKLAVGVSRKSFIGKILGDENNPAPAPERLEGTLAAVIWSAVFGAKILRVHDVMETKRALKVVERLIL